MQVEIKPISSVKPNPSNPRIIKDDKFKKLVQSLKDFPEMMSLRPIVCNPDMIILGGNMRFRAAKDAGWKEIPVIVADIPEEKQREFIIKDNVGFGEWDWDVLANEWDETKLEDWGLEIPDFSGKEAEAKEDDFEISEKIETKIVTGDLIEIGNHRLLCGDSGNSDDVVRLMNGRLADMVFTDPPYGVAYVGKTKDALEIENDDVDESRLKELNKEWFNCVDLATRGGAYILATVPARPLHLIFALDWKERGWLRQILLWNKSSMVMGHSEYHYKHEPILFGWKPGGQRLKNPDRTRTSVWDFDKPSANREHPTMKPVELWAYGIKNHSQKNDLLYEPFSGSGTTFVASEQLGRVCYGMEIDPKYCQVIVNRMLKSFPEIEVKINGNQYIE